MTMAYTSLFSPNLTYVSSTRPTRPAIPFNSFSPFTPFQYSKRCRESSIPSVASIPFQPINVDYLQEEFSGHGVTFEGLGDSCVAKMVMESGNTVTLMLPSGLITSYKACMWHGGVVELLHTSVSEGENGEAVIEGGVSLAFSFAGDKEDIWSPSNWVLKDIRGDSQESIQVELISTDTERLVDLRHIVTLEEDILRSELVVSNTNSSSIRMAGSLISHLTVSTPEATYAVGLLQSDFCGSPPFLSDFSIVPPDFGPENGFDSDQTWSDMVMKGLFTGRGARNQNNAGKAKSRRIETEEEMEEEKHTYKQLNEEMSRIYTTAPRLFTVLDRGRRNSVMVGRDGFEELYMFSPGSSHEFYSKYTYICVGQSAMLTPIILKPGEVWRGGQRLCNPNT
ncbi:photosynthetic NDH subunit of subcomplex B 2 chloroplastic [Tripterygium wilfordii]|uniref:Photosynthetic NDH subunit of subcomplex B 2 chloroplastic n=1 Tax=Tripterygium wilfordii TaxID=458696 RepID=A0A7J7CMG0_TRIWF|nr:protein NDH-DEPENDENT CYCLIC ELECTRON FLOW 5 [Tripterygium wilfordii]KAF5735244.1 photosynthetic NDH subunit of subcomplex B 2 chloroplastic [Tripterygium wilfordii]